MSTQNHGTTYTSINKEISNETLCRPAIELLTSCKTGWMPLNNIFLYLKW